MLTYKNTIGDSHFFYFSRNYSPVDNWAVNIPLFLHALVLLHMICLVIGTAVCLASTKFKNNVAKHIPVFSIMLYKCVILSCFDSLLQPLKPDNTRMCKKNCSDYLSKHRCYSIL